MISLPRLLSVVSDQPPDEASLGHSMLEPYLYQLVGIGMVLLSICIVISLIRILKGPTLADRVLAADALSLFVVGLVVLLGIVMRTSLFFDAALVVAIIGFVSTLAFSNFLFSRNMPPEESPTQEAQS